MKLIQVGVQLKTKKFSTVEEMNLLAEAGYALEKARDTLINSIKNASDGEVKELYSYAYEINQVLRLHKHYTRILYLELTNIKYRTFRVLIYTTDDFDCEDILEKLNSKAEYAFKISHVSELNSYSKVG